jgi:hypothetical protein
MTNINQALRRLREDRRTAQQQVDKLTEAIHVLEGLGKASPAGRVGRAKRILSAAGRRRISLAQKARWAKVRQQQKKAA